MVWFPFLDVEDLPEHLSGAFDDDEQSILVASARVRNELKTARFNVHTSGALEGQPVDVHVRDAIQAAVVAQLDFWAETGDASGAGAQTGGGSILSISLPGGSGSTSAADKEAARVAPAVSDILRGTPGITWTVGY